jgi:hypothetical protein
MLLTYTPIILQIFWRKNTHACCITRHHLKTTGGRSIAREKQRGSVAVLSHNGTFYFIAIKKDLAEGRVQGVRACQPAIAPTVSALFLRGVINTSLQHYHHAVSDFTRALTLPPAADVKPCDLVNERGKAHLYTVTSHTSGERVAVVLAPSNDVAFLCLYICMLCVHLCAFVCIYVKCILCSFVTYPLTLGVVPAAGRRTIAAKQ